MSLKLIKENLKELYPDKSKKELEELIKDVFTVTRNLVDENNRLNVPEFGVFTKKERKGRIVKVPGSNQEVEVPTQETITFKPSKDWKDDLNDN